MATDVFIRFRAEAKQAQSSIQSLRQRLAQLNQTLAEQRNRLIGATAEEQENIRAHIAANIALKATIRSRIEQATLQKQAIAQTMKEARERERAAQQQIRASQQISAAQRALVQDLAIGARVVHQQLSQLTSGFVRAAADMETFRNTINVVTQDAAETNRILANLLRLTVDLVGIDTRDLISYAGRLMATGLSAAEAETAISGVTKRVAEQGKAAFVTRRVLEQFTQAINANHISYHDFRPILRELPTLYRDASNALGVQIHSLEDFRRAAASVGGPTQAILLLLDEMARASEGANLDTFNAQLDILRDQSRLLAAELGEHLIPAIVSVLKQVNIWIERFRHMDDSVQAAIAWAGALATALTGLATVVGVATLGFGALSASLTAITGASGVAALTAGIGGLVAAFAAAAPYIAVGGIIVGGLVLLAKAINDTSEAAQILSVEITRLDQVMQVYNLTTGRLERLTEAQANSYTKFQERVKDTQDEVQELSSRLQENRAEQEKLKDAIENTSSPNAFLVLQQDLDNVIAKEQELSAALDEATTKLQGLKFEIPTENLTEPVDSFEEQIIRAVDEVLGLRDAFGEVARSGEIQEIHTAASALTAALKRELELQLQDAELTAGERLDLELSTAREIEQINSEAQKKITAIIAEGTEQQIERLSELNDFWRAASGGLAGYSESLETTLSSIVNLVKEEQALADAIESNVALISVAVDGEQEKQTALEAARAAYMRAEEATRAYEVSLLNSSVAAQESEDRIQGVARAIANADFRRAAAELRDFDDAFRLSEVTIPRVNSEMERFTGTLPDASRSIRDTTLALRNLSQEAQSAAREAEFLNASFSALDAFDPRTPDLNAPSFDTTGFALRTGEELASQAIRTAGELRRIEEERVENLADLEREYSERIIEINEEKRRKLAEVEEQIEAERLRRLASIEQAFAEAAAAEVAAREQAAERILRIEQKAAEDRERLRERLNDRLLELEQRRDARIQELNDGFIERERDRQAAILAVTERAAAARLDAEQQYADRVQEINNRLVEDILEIQRGLQAEIESLEEGFLDRQADRADEVVRITEEAAEARVAANQVFSETMQGIYNDLVEAWDDLEEGFLEREEDRAAERIAIEQDAADARIAANEEYADTVAKISTDLVDDIRRIEAEIVDVQEQHAEDRLEIEQASIEDRAEANAEYARQVEQIEMERERRFEEQARRLAEIHQEATDARLEADQDYADTFQDIQNDLVDRVVDIQGDLNDTLNDLRDEQLNAEKDRLDNLVELHEETQQKIEDLEREGAQTLEDLRREYQQDQLDAATQLDRDLQDAEGDPEKEAAARQKFQRRIEDLTREFNRKALELQIRQRRDQEAIARQAAAKEQEIAERNAAERARIAQQEADARLQAQERIEAAESAAGVAFLEAQENYIPALSAHEQALLEHANALNSINQAEAAGIAELQQERSEALKESIDATATAAMTLSETLAAVTAAEQERLSALAAQTATSIQDLEGQRSAAESQAGVTFEEALVNYTPAVDLNTQALQALTSALTEIDADEVSALGAVDAAGIEDLLSTQTAQQALEAQAGVTIEAARLNYVPALSRAAEATLTLNETMQALDASFREAIAEIQTVGLVDRQAVDAAIRIALADATAQQTALETQAGTTFADASLAFQPGLSDIAQAGIDRDTAISDIDQTEIADIDAINAQAIADRLETDASITETRDAYIKARDTEIFKHNVAMLQLNTAEAADIKAVRETLRKNLESIDKKLDLELAEIREQKAVFDAKISELITAINEQANQDVASLKEDTAAMRSSLEAIAAEAKDNAWKKAILKVASVGIQITGVAAGAALGNPVAGLAAGQAVGNLVEEGGNELFHFSRTDRIARNIARQSALRRTRETPAYLPDANQIRNSRDLSREIVRGVSEGLAIGERREGGFGSASEQASLPEEITATIQIQFPDGSVQELRDQMVRLEQQDR